MYIYEFYAVNNKMPDRQLHEVVVCKCIEATECTETDVIKEYGEILIRSQPPTEQIKQVG